MAVLELRSVREVDEFARGLLSAGRREPWCVVSTDPESGVPLFELSRIDDELDGLCRVALLPTGDLSRRFASRLPPRCQVYGGAARVYPVGAEWHERAELSPLRFIHAPSDRGPATDRLIEDGISMASEAGLLAQQAAKAGVRVTGLVVGFLAGGERAFVKLDNGRLATVHNEFAGHGTPLEWMLTDGQCVSGLLDEGSGRLVVDLTAISERAVLELYRDQVTLAYVLEVERQRATLAVHPRLPIPVTRADVTSNPRDRVDQFLAPGDVVPVRVIRDPQGRARLRLSDVDDDEPVLPPPALVVGGAPWLVEGRHRPVGPDQEPLGRDASDDNRTPQRLAAPDAGETVKAGVAHETIAVAVDPLMRIARAPRAEPAPKALRDTQLALEAERAKVRELEHELRMTGDRRAREEAALLRLELGQVFAERDSVRLEAQRLRREAQELRELLRRTSRPTSDALGFRSRRRLFDAAEEWIQHEVLLAWLERLPASERAARPLPSVYRIGAGFAESLTDLDEGQLAKAFKAVVDVLTGLVWDVGARRPHPLRTGIGAEDAELARPADGARCIRVHIEQHVAAARRLHYWQLPDGTIELSRIVTHDDMEP